MPQWKNTRNTFGGMCFMILFFLTWLNFWTHNFFPKFLTFLVARHHFERSYKAQAWFPIKVLGPTIRF